MRDHVTVSMLTYASAEPRKCARQWRIFAALFIVAHPLFFHVGACLTWLLGWIEIGRPPRSMLDNPQGFGVHFVGTISLASLLLWPLVAFLAILVMFIVFDRCRDVARLASLGCCAYVLAIALIQWDPGSIIGWILD